MLALVLVLVLVVATVAGALGGRWLVLREVRHWRGAVIVAKEATQRANRASATLEAFENRVSATLEAFDAPTVLDRVERMNDIVMRWQSERAGLEERAVETAALVRELELALAGSFGINVTRKD